MITDTLHSHVLQLDLQGTPQAWISLEQAATHVATDSVAWVDGDGPLATLRGGINVQSGAQSLIDIHPIMALRGASRVNLYERVPGYTRARLFRRDRHTCAYCGEHLADRWLTCDHIVPQCQGGGWDWMNLVTACRSCNSRKAGRTPEQARMPLLFLPYVPSRHESFLLEGRHIRADVHDWLVQRVPAGSRVRQRGH